MNMIRNRGWTFFESPWAASASDTESESVDELFAAAFAPSIFKSKSNRPASRKWGRVIMVCAECSRGVEITEDGYTDRTEAGVRESATFRDIVGMVFCARCEHEDPSRAGMIGYKHGVDFMEGWRPLREIVQACQVHSKEPVEVKHAIVERREIFKQRKWPVSICSFRTDYADDGQMHIARQEGLRLNWI